MLDENHFPPAGQPGQVILDYIYLDDGRMIGVASTRAFAASFLKPRSSAHW